MFLPDIPGLESFDAISQTSNTTTWRAYQRSLDRHVMVKALRTEAASDPRQVEQFVSVFRAIARIKADAFCQIYDVCSAHHIHYVVMEDVVGQALSDRVQAAQRSSVTQMLRYAYDLADALGKAWTSDRLVHCNLKPTAIRITPAGTAKLTDFGMAVLMPLGGRTGQTDEDTIIGTPNFIAPEQITRSHPIDCRTDMYALGMILYFGLTGQIPFGDQSPEEVVRSQVQARLPGLRDVRPDTPLSVCALVERLLMKDPTNRYSSWSEVLADLTRLLENKPIRRSPLLGTELSTLTSSQVPLSKEDRAVLTSARQYACESGFGFGRFVLWLLLALWFAVLGNYRLGDPVGLDSRVQHAFALLLPAPPSIPDHAPADAPPEGLVAPVPAPPEIAPTPPEVVPAPPKIRVQETRSTDLPPDAAFHRALANAYGTGGVAAMQAFLASWLASGHIHPEYKAMQADLAALEPLDRLASRALAQASDTEMSLKYRDKTRLVIPKAVADGEVIFFFPEQKRHVTIKIATLSDAEKIRLLGPRLTPQQAAAACLRLVETGNREAARAHAADAGALAPILTLLAAE
jgi:serine/threonine protein kinase